MSAVPSEVIAAFQSLFNARKNKTGWNNTVDEIPSRKIRCNLHRPHFGKILPNASNMAVGRIEARDAIKEMKTQFSTMGDVTGDLKTIKILVDYYDGDLSKLRERYLNVIRYIKEDDDSSDDEVTFVQRKRPAPSAPTPAARKAPAKLFHVIKPITGKPGFQEDLGITLLRRNEQIPTTLAMYPAAIPPVPTNATFHIQALNSKFIAMAISYKDVHKRLPTEILDILKTDTSDYAGIGIGLVGKSAAQACFVGGGETSVENTVYRFALWCDTNHYEWIRRNDHSYTTDNAAIEIPKSSRPLIERILRKFAPKTVNTTEDSVSFSVGNNKIIIETRPFRSIDDVCEKHSVPTKVIVQKNQVTYSRSAHTYYANNVYIVATTEEARLHSEDIYHYGLAMGKAVTFPFMDKWPAEYRFGNLRMTGIADPTSKVVVLPTTPILDDSVKSPISSLRNVASICDINWNDESVMNKISGISEWYKPLQFNEMIKTATPMLLGTHYSTENIAEIIRSYAAGDAEAFDYIMLKEEAIQMEKGKIVCYDIRKSVE